MRLLGELFLSFLKIGAFTIGGGYAMIPLFEEEFVKKKNWLTDEDFFNMLTVVTASPGPLAVNSAVFTGYRVAGALGSVFAVIGVTIAPVIIITVIAINYRAFREMEAVESAFKALRPAVVALIFAAVYKLAGRNELVPLEWMAVAGVCALIYFWGVDPVILLVVAIVLSIVVKKVMLKYGRKGS